MAAEVSSNLFRHAERTQQINLDAMRTLRAWGLFFFCPFVVPLLASPPPLTPSAPLTDLLQLLWWVSSETSNRSRLRPVIIGEVTRSAAVTSRSDETVASSGQRRRKGWRDLSSAPGSRAAAQRNVHPQGRHQSQLLCTTVYSWFAKHLTKIILHKHRFIIKKFFFKKRDKG